MLMVWNWKEKLKLSVKDKELYRLSIMLAYM